MPAGELTGFSSALIHSAKRIGRDSLRLQRAAISLRTIFYLPLTWLSHASQGCHLTTPPHPSPGLVIQQREWRELCFL